MAKATVQDELAQLRALLKEARDRLFEALEAKGGISAVLDVLEDKGLPDLTGEDYGLILAMRACLRQIESGTDCHVRIEQALRSAALAGVPA